jgi:uroporphyrinogen-III synthase
MRPLLVLRPEPGASVTVRRARERGLVAAAVPLFVVEPVPWNAPDPAAFDGLLLTSANALRHGGEQLQSLRGLNVYAVGDATADAARERGFGIASSGDDGVDHLLASIEGDLKLLHLCGEDRRQPQQPRQQITAAPVYRSREIERPELSEAFGSVALIHSPRAGERFAELIADRGSIAIAAISPAAAEAAGEGWETVGIAEAPNDEALLALAASLCNKPQPK